MKFFALRRLILWSGMTAFFWFLVAPSVLLAETRSLKIYYIHTKEKAEIVYKKDGRYIDDGLKKLNHLLRDWRRNEPTKMDPRLFDLVWQVYKLSGSRDYIHVVSAYRSPATNNMLRSRSTNSGVAKNSQHTLGKALDFYLPDVNLAKLRAVGLRQQAGGVGYYPTSGSPFIHLDVGSVRHWPKMNRKDLMALFPDGKTMHVPSDGKPLDGYNQALAAYNARKGAPAEIVVSQEKTRKSRTEKKPLFAGLFGKKKGKENPDKTTTVAAKSSTVSPVVVASPEPVQIEQTAQIAQTEQVVLPDSGVPIPAFSPLREPLVAATVLEPQPRDDEIAALLVAHSDAVTSLTSLPEMGFVPIPVLKTIPESTNLVQEEPMQTAYLPTLSQQLPLPQAAMPPPVKNENYPVVFEKRQDEKGEKQDLMIASETGDHQDLASFDRDQVRALIIEAQAFESQIAESAESLDTAETDHQMVAAILPRTTPKSDRPRFDELALLIARDEEQRQAEAEFREKKIHQIPQVVFASGLQKIKKQPLRASLDGKAINFPPVARTVVAE